jgi:hypothetical protein
MHALRACAADGAQRRRDGSGGDAAAAPETSWPRAAPHRSPRRGALERARARRLACRAPPNTPGSGLPASRPRRAVRRRRTRHLLQTGQARRGAVRACGSSFCAAFCARRCAYAGATGRDARAAPGWRSEGAARATVGEGKTWQSPRGRMHAKVLDTLG